MPSKAIPLDKKSAGVLAAMVEKNGLQFHIQTGGKKYICTLQDRDSYERTKTKRVNSFDSAMSVDTFSSSEASELPSPSESEPSDKH